jgi:hypothetical protein
LLKGKVVSYVIITLLITALGYTSSAAFAYWQDVSNQGNVIINIGEDQASLLVVPLHSQFEGTLVPEGFDFLEGEFTEVVFEYGVSVDQNLVRSVNLIVEAIDVKIGGLELYGHLVDIQIASSGRYFVNELFNSVVNVQVTIKLLEPIDLAEATEKGLSTDLVNVEDSQAAAAAIFGADISFTLLFRVEPKNND